MEEKQQMIFISIETRSGHMSRNFAEAMFQNNFLKLVMTIHNILR